MKKLIAVIIALLCAMGIILLFNPTIIYVDIEGYVVTSEYNLASTFSQSEADNVYLHYLEADNMIYSSLFKDYDYQDKTEIDMSYPMYTNNGATLHFLTNDYWMISDDFCFLETYQGLYLTDGTSYNADLSQADGEEFLLVSLGNGLYMNAQNSVFYGPGSTTVIPANSIIQFTNDDVRFYEFNTGGLSYTSIDEVFGATISIGDHSYDYVDFLKALDLFQDAITALDKGDDIYEIQQEIEELIGDEDDSKGNNGSGQSSSGNTLSETNDDSDNDGSRSGANEGDNGNTNASGSQSGNSKDGGSAGSAGSSSGSAGSSSGSGSGAGGSSMSSGSSGGSSGSGSAAGSASGGDGIDTAGGSNSSQGGSGSDEGVNDGEFSTGTGVVGTGDGDTLEPEYSIPSVSISDFDIWGYAINADLTVTDNSSLLTKGVTVAVYAGFKNVEFPVSSGTYEGVKVYSADKYTGYLAKLRKIFYSTQEVTLDGLEPGKEYYLQYSYSYSAEIVGDDGVKYYSTVTVLSDFYEITTKTIAQSNLPTVNLTYDNVFASYSDRLEFDNFYLENDSAYDEEDTSFDNFKLNVLPYVSKIVLTLTDQEGNEKEISITSAYLKKAMVEGGIDYTSLAASLSSNSKYTYTMELFDKYGNSLSLNVNSSDNYTGTLYTAKKQPTVTVEEVENITDSLTIKVTVSDPDGALESIDGDITPLQLIATNTSGETTYLSGTWIQGSTDTLVDSGDDNILDLPEPTDDTVYEFSMDSLAFARTYTFSVYGNYIMQPDFTTDLTVANQTNVLFGSGKSYTKSITSGSIDVDVTYDTIEDKSAKIRMQISTDSNAEVLALVDEFRVQIKDTDNNLVQAYAVLQESELGNAYVDAVDTKYPYNVDTGSVVLWSEYGVTVELVGTYDQFATQSLWKSLLMETITDTEDITTTKNAVHLRITMDETLETWSAHQISYEGIVIKAGVEYSIPVTLSSSSFQSKKLPPAVSMEDFFIVNDEVTLLDFDVTDIDGAVVGNGDVEVWLYQGSSLLQKRSVLVADEPQDVNFTGLTAGITYTLKVVILQYNDDVGYASLTSNVVVETYEIVAGSDISATITLNSLDYVYENKTTDPVFTVTGTQCAEGLADTADNLIEDKYKQWTNTTGTTTNGCNTEYFSIDEFDLDGSNVLELEYQPSTTTSQDATVYTNKYIYFYGSTYNSLGSVNASIGSGGNLVAIIPEGTAYVRFVLGDLDYLEQWGFRVYGYTMDSDDDLVVSLTANTPNADWVNSSYGDTKDIVYKDSSVSTVANATTITTNTTYRVIYQLPVQPGDVYFTTSNATSGDTYMYNEAKTYVGVKSSISKNTCVVIPEGVYYISFRVYNSHDFKLYHLSGATGENGAYYQLDADLSVYDKKGYLLDDSGASTVYMLLEYSSSISEPSYDTTEVNIPIDLTAGEDGYIGAMNYVNSLLEPNSAYRLSIMADYKGTLTIASQEFQTDGAYLFINSAADMYKLAQYPYGNFLVTADFTANEYQNITFYGTIDFDGHKITRSIDNSYLINTLGLGAVLKNLYYIVDSGTVQPIIASNYGTVENIIIETTGNVESTSNDKSLLVSVNNGLIQNFIIALGGDITLNYYNNAIAVRYMGSGATLQNGYIYSKDGGDLIVPVGYSSIGGLIGSHVSPENVSNIYMIYDTYIGSTDADTTTDTGYSIISSNGITAYNNIYHQGDYYTYNHTSSTPKTSNPLEQWRVIRNTSNVNQMEQVWCISAYSYEPYDTTDTTQVATISMLYDQTWQGNVLIDGFQIEETVSMGYYPRLELPTCMEQHQEYLSLPISTQAEIPTIVSDQVTTGTVLDMTSGYLTLRLENPNALAITDVQISGLRTVVQSCSLSSDGLYDVNLYVSVDSSDESYVNGYQVESITYVSGSATKTTTTDYTTTSLSFYKSVSSLEDWYAINENMTWNYRLTADLDFSNSTLVNAIVLNGNRANITSTTLFSGTIDGGKYNAEGELENMYTISGIQVTNVANAFVIYRLSATGKVSNLIIKDLELSVNTSTQSSTFSGFIGYGYAGSVLENVHMVDANVSSSGYVGGFFGQTSATITNCSINQLQITLNGNQDSTYIGGMAGYFGSSTLSNSYVKGLTITANDTKTVYGIGGLVGYATYINMYNCYVEGSITSDGKNIGGAIGQQRHSYSTSKNIWTDVEINTIGENVGGVEGYKYEGAVSNTIALGDVFAGTNNVHRISGLKVSADNYLRPNYAYQGQKVNTLTTEDVDDATLLFTGSQLSDKKTWTDTMGFGSQWDYTALDEGYLPLLYKQNTTELLYGQDTGVQIPGNESISAEFAFADITEVSTESEGNIEAYLVDITITCEGYDSDALKTALVDGTLTYEIEGMSMLEVEYDETCSRTYIEQSGYWTTIITPVTGSDAVTLTIVTTEITNAYDVYKFILKDGDAEISVMIDYGDPLYFKVYNLNDWNEYMSSGHGRTAENFYICGTVDFGGKTPDYTSLILGDLIGEGEKAAFTNMAFTTTSNTGGNWISSCRNITGIDFTKLSANFETVPVTQTAATFIYSCTGLENVNIDNLTIQSNNSSAGGMGLCYEITGNVVNVDVTNVALESEATGTSSKNYTGAICGYLLGSFTEIEASDITIDFYYGNYVGGLFGFVKEYSGSGNTMVNSDVTLSDVTINARTIVGGLLGQSDWAYQLQNITLENIDITAQYHAGGICDYGTFLSSSYTNNNLTIRNSSVVSTKSDGTDTRTGGMFGRMYYYGSYYDLVVENVTVQGTVRVGGLVGFSDCPTITGVQIINCDVTQHDDADIDSSYIGVGGVAGRWTRDENSTGYIDVVVRDTQILGDYNVGGVVGSNMGDYNITLNNIYVAEDVSVMATKDNAGGIMGYANEFIMEDVACGATVIAWGSNAGGIIGYLGGVTDHSQSITGVYTRGSVTAGNNVGGVFGYVSSDVSITDSNLAGVIVASDLNSGGTGIHAIANFQNTVSYQSGNIGVWDNMLMNGQTVENYYTTTDASGDSKVYILSGVSLLTADTDATDDAFLQKETYTTYGMTDFDDSHLSGGDVVADSNYIYMPFITDSDGSGEILRNSDSYEIISSITKNEGETSTEHEITYTTKTESVGIERPVPGENEDATVVYVSGVDSINIETKQDSVTIMLGGGKDTSKTVTIAGGDSDEDVAGGTVTSSPNDGVTTYTYTFTDSDKLADSYNTITIGYDFTTDITVDNVTYQAKDLVKTVMTDQPYWYYIGDANTDNVATSIYYGGTPTSTTTITAIEEDTVMNPIHMWQGKVMTSSGSVYQRSGTSNSTSWSAVDTTEVLGLGEIQSTAKPIFDGGTYDVYYHFTVTSDTNYGWRIYSLGSDIYNVFSSMGAVYDSYILSNQSSSRYFALLLDSGELKNYETTLNTGNFTNSGIVQISNNFNYTEPIVVVKYDSGRVVVLNYVTGAVVSEYGTSLVEHTLETVNGLIMTMSGTAVTTDDSYARSNALLGTFISSGGIDGDAETAQAGNGESISEDGADAGVVDIADQEDGGDEASNVGASSGSSSLGDEENYVESNGGISLTSLDVGGVDGTQAVAGIDGDGDTASDGTSADDSNGISAVADTANSSGDSNNAGTDSTGNGSATDLEDNDSSDTDASEESGSGSTKGDSDNSDSTDEDSEDAEEDDSLDGDTTLDGSVGSGSIGTGEDETTDGTTESDETATGVDGDGGATDDTGSDNDQTGSDNEGEVVSGDALADSDYMLAYNPFTGNYEVYGTEEFLTSSVTSESKNSAMERFIEELLKVEDDENTENNFVVRKLSSNILSTDERNGFILLSIIALSCIIVLIVMHVKVRKR